MAFDELEEKKLEEEVSEEITRRLNRGTGTTGSTAAGMTATNQQQMQMGGQQMNQQGQVANCSNWWDKCSRLWGSLATSSRYPSSSSSS